MLNSAARVLVTALLLGAPVRAADDPPGCSTTLTLPQTALQLRLEHRQLDPDLSRFQEPEGLDHAGLRQLQILAHLSQGLQLESGVTLRVGGAVLEPGRYRMGFTVSRGGALRFFVVRGTEALALPSVELPAGWVTERLVLHLEYASRTDVRIVWHLGAKAGSITLGLGTSGPPASAPALVPAPAGQPTDGAPRGG